MKSISTFSGMQFSIPSEETFKIIRHTHLTQRDTVRCQTWRQFQRHQAKIFVQNTPASLQNETVLNDKKVTLSLCGVFTILLL